MVKPIRPDEIGEAKQDHIPGNVFLVFNSAIARHMTEGRARVTQEEVVNELIDRGMSRSLIFDNGWLNVEEAYEAAGWKVTYDKPCYNEEYGAFFLFEKPK